MGTSNEPKIVFNHAYYIKHDEKRCLVISQPSREWSNCMEGWISKIHPIYAMILSLLSEPLSKQEAIAQAAAFLDVNDSVATELIEKLMESKEPFEMDFDNLVSWFPPSIILEVPSDSIPSIPIVYEPQQFCYDSIDLTAQRLIQSPMGIVWMINNTCLTECEYCYADKSTKSSSLNLSEVTKMLDDISHNNIKSLQIVGGEFFRYQNWRELLKLLKSYNLLPELVSTKMPLSADNIAIIGEYGIQIQVSLDSFNPDTIASMWRVKSDYLSKIIDTIHLLEKYNVKYQIATVLTKSNSSNEELKSLSKFLSTLENLKRWEVRVAFRSLYSRKSFDTIKLSPNEIVEIEKIVKSLMETFPKNILWVKDSGREYFTAKEGSRSFKGSRCSANYSHMVVLPDGNVTICEQLYWAKRFIIGDVKHQTIRDIWNSPEALHLAKYPQSCVQSTSRCHDCKLYDDCQLFPNKCYADTIKAYGWDNWDYPDPRCEKALPFLHSLS